ncbi:hypothetical protein Rhe02_43400 [Rhizocola hellebori]|uniref:DUF2613 family protein n=1 Tax=Rhizocola hellebori TaxID=1392758 RepID=A0A8J3Q8T7_9ACTN|nr:hypothetical protein [Rhizocola hellebori]GIH06273.1 hypothetical protein Rhe02_43400 [Rhizocola hellebori]
MGRSGLTLLLTAILAIALGVVGTITLASSVVATSADAAKAGSLDLGKPEGYGSR